MSTERLFIGVDGGASSTLTVLANHRGELLAGAVSGPCDHIDEPGGPERHYSALRDGYESVMAWAGLPLEAVEGVFLGLTGKGNLPIIKRVYGDRQITLRHDTLTALIGAIPEGVGAIIISGTGAAAFGRNSQGEEALTGAMGFYAGDEGSGYDIAQKAIRAIYQAADGRAEPTRLTELVLRHFDCPDLMTLHQRIYSGALTRDQLARAARIASAAAQEGDSAALRILEQAGIDLGIAVSAVLRRLHMMAGPVPIATVGGVFEAGDPLVMPMMRKISGANPEAHRVKPRFIPALGAVILALRQAVITVDEPALANLSRTLSRLPVSGSGQKFES
jgi:N-acetylglucosamine kinase-like BadF-type ATPase